jgi:hypothetical protein
MMARFCVAGLADAVIGGVTIGKGIGPLAAEKTHWFLRQAAVARFVRDYVTDSFTVCDRKPFVAGPYRGVPATPVKTHWTLYGDGIGRISDDSVVAPISVKILHIWEEHHAGQTIRLPSGTGHGQSVLGYATGIGNA